MPSPDAPFRLGTRRSPLAMTQAEEARDRLCAAHGWPFEAVELVTVIASGDRVQDRPLAEIGGKALWTRELDRWLAERRIDAAVHSMKDVETIRPPELALGAVLPRADAADVLLGAVSIEAIAHGARLGTSAPRRAAQMLHRRPDVTVVPFRGNVATRMAKLEAGEADVTLLAAAGLDRLGEQAGVRLDPENWLPAPAQGAIGLECRAGDANALALLAAIDDRPSRARGAGRTRTAGRTRRHLPQPGRGADADRGRPADADRRGVFGKWSGTRRRVDRDRCWRTGGSARAR